MIEEKFANFDAVTTLAADCDDSETVLSVADASGLAAAIGDGWLRLSIDDELMLCTSVNEGDDEITVIRNIEGIAAAEHSAGALVEPVLTAGGLLEALQEAKQGRMVANVASSTIIAPDDLVWLDPNTVTAKPASGFAYGSSLAATQEAFFPYFLGRAIDASANGETDPIRVAKHGLHAFPCDSANFTVGDWVGPDDNVAGNALLNQQVIAVNAPSRGIGRVVQGGVGVTSVLVSLRGSSKWGNDSSVPRIEVWVTGTNGFGSTSGNKIQRFSTIQRNDLGIYTDSVANGSAFTVPFSGRWWFEFYVGNNAAQFTFGLTLNSASLTTNVDTLNFPEVRARVRGLTANILPCVMALRLDAGDIIRPHTDGTTSSTTSGSFRMMFLGA